MDHRVFADLAELRRLRIGMWKLLDPSLVVEAWPVRLRVTFDWRELPPVYCTISA